MTVASESRPTPRFAMFIARSSSRRMLLAMFASSALCGLFLIYTHFVTPRVSRNQEDFRSAPPLPPPPPPRDAREFAERYLKHQPFAQEARYQVKSPDAFIYAQEWEHGDDHKAVRFTPFAMVWTPQGRDDRQAEPMTISCRSAVIQFEAEFRIDKPKPGRMIAGTLFGDVRITGADGLDIKGRHFTFSDEALRIFSDHPVEFAYDKHHGTARGVQMELIRLEQMGEDEMFAVSGIRSIRLRRNVEMTFQVDAKTAASLSAGTSTKKSKPLKDESVPLLITSVGPFDFNLENNIGSFQDQVRVERQTTPIYKDSLETHLLKLFFEEKLRVAKNVSLQPPGGHVLPDLAEEEETETVQPDKKDRFKSFERDLELRRLLAEGPNVLIVSEENTATASMEQFDYDANARVAYMAATSKNRKVRVVQGYSELESPEIRVDHDEDGNVRTVVCRGRGWLKRRDEETGEISLACEWAKQLRKYKDPKSDLQVLEMEPQAIVRAPNRGVGLAADFIKLWFAQIEKKDASPGPTLNLTSSGSPPGVGRTLFRTPDGNVEASPVSTVSSRTGKNSAADKMSKLKFEPNRMLALKNVAMIGPKVQGETDRLEVWFKAADPNVVRLPTNLKPKKTDAQPVSARRNNAVAATSSNGNTSKAPPAEKNEPPLILEADLVRAQVIMFPGETDPEIAEIETHGRVDVKRKASKPGTQSLHMRGNMVRLKNPGGTAQTAHVYGRPALIERPDFQFEGNELHLDRSKNLAWVNGGGVLQLLVTKSMDNKKLKVPVPLRVWWKEQMRFDGRTAQFFGDVRSVLEENEMQCQQMNIELTEQISFVEDADDLGDIFNGDKDTSDKEGVEALGSPGSFSSLARLESQKPTSKKQRPEIFSVLCQDDVMVRSREYKDKKLIAIRHAHFAKFAMNEQTGESEASGPGWITSWNRGGGKRAGLTKTAIARANDPISTEKSEWEYWRVNFVGTTKGNVKHRTATFQDRIKVIYGPVERPLEIIDPDKLSPKNFPKKAVVMRCQKLRGTQHPETKTREAFMEMVADGNAELEGKQFHARADRISFDESKEQYTLRSWAPRKAVIWMQNSVGDEYSPNAGQSMTFRPKDGRLQINQGTVLGGVQ